MSVAKAIKTKTCEHCGKSKPATEHYFNVQRGSTDGYFKYCKVCTKHRLHVDQYKKFYIIPSRNYKRKKYVFKNADLIRDCVRSKYKSWHDFDIHADLSNGYSKSMLAVAISNKSSITPSIAIKIATELNIELDKLFYI